MATSNEILESLRVACRRSDHLPSSVTYSTVQLDSQGEHANVSLPIIEFEINEIDPIKDHNTSRTGVEVDDRGNEVGYVHDHVFQMEMQANVMTASQGAYNHRQLDQRLRDILTLYDKSDLAKPLPHPENRDEILEGIIEFEVGSIQPAHDFGTSPTLRARQIKIYVEYKYERLTSDLGVEYEVIEDVILGSVGSTQDARPDYVIE